MTSNYNVLLFASSMLHITTASSVYNVRSDDNITISLNDTESGESLEYYLMNTIVNNSPAILDSTSKWGIII